MRKLFTMCILIVGLLSAFLVAGAIPARAAVQASSCNYWSTDTQSTSTVSGYRWNVAMSSLRDCSTGKYLGKVSDHIVLTVPSNPVAYIAFWNEAYTNMVPVVEKWQGLWPLPNTTYTSDSGSWSVSSGQNAEACGAALDATGWTISSLCVYNNNVH